MVSATAKAHPKIDFALLEEVEVAHIVLTDTTIMTWLSRAR